MKKSTKSSNKHDVIETSRGHTIENCHIETGTVKHTPETARAIEAVAKSIEANARAAETLAKAIYGNGITINAGHGINLDHLS